MNQSLKPQQIKTELWSPRFIHSLLFTSLPCLNVCSLVMICLSTQNGTAPPPTLTVKIREILEQITGYVVGTPHNLTSGDNKDHNNT